MAEWQKIKNLEVLANKLQINGGAKNTGEKNLIFGLQEKCATGEENDVAASIEPKLLMNILKKELVNSDLPLNILQKNPNSPLFSEATFESLHLKPELIQAIYLYGFNTPSKIQVQTLPILLADPPKNIIAQSQSGTGKTAAFVLAMLSRVDTSLNYPQVLCLSPTYELAIQTGEAAAHLGRYCSGIKIKFVVRGEKIERNSKITDHILIGTPGKMLDWGIKFQAFDLKKISIFVLDEADVMISKQGHHDQCIRIHKMLSPQCQKLFFSATYDQEVKDFAHLIVSDPTVISLERKEEALDNIKQYYVLCKNADEKYNAIRNIYGCISIGQAIIFCRTRVDVDILTNKMISDGHAVAKLSGDLTVEQRLDLLDCFRRGFQKVLITTNVLSRGIDVVQVTLIVNFDLPINLGGEADCETYLHRIGRSGRFGKPGIAINLIDSEWSMDVCRTIEKHFNKEIKHLNTDDADDIEKIGN